MFHLCCVAIFLVSAAGRIQGTVTDEQTGLAIPNANIMVQGTTIGTATDGDGSFFILNVPSGTYTVEVSFIGYQTKRILDVAVEYDKTVRLNVSLQPSAVEIAPLDVTSERAGVSKEMVGTTYIVGKDEISSLPVDRTTDLIAFQAAVARTDTAFHVRGGRPTEVQYMIDDVSIIDPLTGSVAINISKGIIDEVIFLPGGFNAEYGRAMSGVINMITSHPGAGMSAEVRGKTEHIMPDDRDFGYSNVNASVPLPLGRRLAGYVALDFMHTDDWDPRLTILPHKERDDYSVYGKCLYDASAKVKVNFDGAMSQSRFDRYETLWKFNLDHYRSDLEKGDLQSMSIRYLPDSRRFFQMTVSRLHFEQTFGVREDTDNGIFDEYDFRPYETLSFIRPSMDNPFGAYVLKPYGDGDYPEYSERMSTVIKTALCADLQIHQNHEVRAGVERVFQRFNAFTYFISDSLHQLTDEYEYRPAEYSAYLQDNIDLGGAYARLGCRYDYFSSDIDSIEPKHYVSPRLGLSFDVSDDLIVRANIGLYAQPPLYDQMYCYYNMLPLPSYLFGLVPILGNPELRPERTVSYELGAQGAITDGFNVTFNAFYKDVTDLIGTRAVHIRPLHPTYLQYVNIEYANIKGIETILEAKRGPLAGKISYTLSWTRGTSSYASEFGDTTVERPACDYYLDFDQRHRIFFQGTIRLPYSSQMHVFAYFGNGFPYTPPDPEGKYVETNYERLSFQRQIDCLLSKTFTVGRMKLSVDLEIINILDHQYEITPHFPQLREPNLADFDDYITLQSEYYSPAADADHDGMISPYEDYLSYVAVREATDDIVHAYSEPRRARIGVAISY